MSMQIRAIATQLNRIIDSEITKAVQTGTYSSHITRQWLTNLLRDKLRLTVSPNPNLVEWRFREFGCETIFIEFGGLNLAYACNWDENPDGINRVEILQPLYYRTEEKVYMFGMEPIKRDVLLPLLETWNSALVNYLAGTNPAYADDMENCNEL